MSKPIEMSFGTECGDPVEVVVDPERKSVFVKGARIVTTLNRFRPQSPRSEVQPHDVHTTMRWSVDELEIGMNVKPEGRSDSYFWPLAAYPRIEASFFGATSCPPHVSVTARKPNKRDTGTSGEAVELAKCSLLPEDVCT